MCSQELGLSNVTVGRSFVAPTDETIMKTTKIRSSAKINLTLTILGATMGATAGCAADAQTKAPGGMSSAQIKPGATVPASGNSANASSRVIGGAGNDTLIGGRVAGSSDTLAGRPTGNTLHGGAGDDTLLGHNLSSESARQAGPSFSRGATPKK